MTVKEFNLMERQEETFERMAFKLEEELKLVIFANTGKKTRNVNLQIICAFLAATKNALVTIATIEAILFSAWSGRKNLWKGLRENDGVFNNCDHACYWALAWIQDRL